MASFPLVPYSNRIGFARFDWADQTVLLQANFSPEPHSIHGTGWTSAWEAERLGPGTVILRLVHHANADWYWPFEAEQRITLSANALEIRLIARNRSDQKVPLAIGHHPYFDSKGATLFFNARQVWHTGADGLPAFASAPQGDLDFANHQAVQGRILDNGYAGWDGKARIHWQDRPLQLDIAADMQAAVVYVPQDQQYFCFEPVPHIINALNLPEHSPQMPLVEPGACYETQIVFTATPA
jgi:aldose 1-epimerase